MDVDIIIKYVYNTSNIIVLIQLIVQKKKKRYY